MSTWQETIENSKEKNIKYTIIKYFRAINQAIGHSKTVQMADSPVWENELALFSEQNRMEPLCFKF